METSARRDVYKELKEAPNLDFFYLKGSVDTPEVLLDLNDNGCLIKLSGRSLPEDSRNFYSPIMDWLIKYSNSELINTKIIFQFEYINSSSSKLLLELLDLIRQIFSKGKEDLLFIEWRYLEDDDDMLEAGQDFEDRVGIKFKYIAYW
ncbi:MAG: SiaC family regulatory phosphoprotein [Bacteroidales bacterium]